MVKSVAELYRCPELPGDVSRQRRVQTETCPNRDVSKQRRVQTETRPNRDIQTLWDEAFL